MDLAHDKLLDKAKGHKTATVEYHHNKENRQVFTVYPAIVSASIDAVHSSEIYRSPPRTRGRYGLTCTI